MPLFFIPTATSIPATTVSKTNLSSTVFLSRSLKKRHNLKPINYYSVPKHPSPFTTITIIIHMQQQQQQKQQSDDENPTIKITIPPDHLKSSHVLGLGLSCMDVLAHVPHFPVPDSKIRTTSVSTVGGGNCANVMSSLSRLGLPVSFITQFGNDAYGMALRSELQSDHVDLTHAIIRQDVSSAFAFVLIDDENETRTSIGTVPKTELNPMDFEFEKLLSIHLHSSPPKLIVLDGRHILAAIALAKSARKLNIPILLDIERDRPHIKDLLPLVDYIVTNQTYPAIFAPQMENDIHAIDALFKYCPYVKFIIQTLGKNGSTLLRPYQSSHRNNNNNNNNSGNKDIVVVNNESQYEVFKCPSRNVDKVVDTTGAGDAFISGVAYGIVTNMTVSQMLTLGSYIAAQKISATGRTGLPYRSDIPLELLEKERTTRA